MNIAIPHHIAEKISPRCQRCYYEQQWYGENFLFEYIGDTDIKGKMILEIGCAEAGLMKFYDNKGAICSGLELSDTRFRNAILLNQEKTLHLFQADICKPKTFEDNIKEQYDLIIMRDVIEHIPNQELALKNIYSLLKPGGKLFMSFPPKYCAYAGHQQTIPKILGKLPYLHLMPNLLYLLYLKIIGCPEKKIKYLIDTKSTRISIGKMKKIINRIGYDICKQSNWLIRPAYSFRFGLPKIKNPFFWIPMLDEIFCNGILFLLVKKD
ncbi:MAG: class I SAM-dependent methyltransferase [Candidatus Neomarinimicrobiota bacterium]